MTEVNLGFNLTLVLLFVAIGIFGSLAIQSKSIKSFQFHITIIILIWILGEIMELTNNFGILELRALEMLPSLIHMISMILIGIVFWLRYYYSRLTGRKLIDDVFD